MSSSVRSRWVRSTSAPILRASMNSVWPRRSRNFPFFFDRVRNQRQAGIWVVSNNWPGSAIMQSTRSASIIFRRISPSPDWLLDIDPLARTNPAMPLGARWWTMCCTHAKFALPTGGVPYFQRASSLSRSPPQSLTLNGGLAPFPDFLAGFFRAMSLSAEAVDRAFRGMLWTIRRYGRDCRTYGCF